MKKNTVVPDPLLGQRPGLQRGPVSPPVGSPRIAALHDAITGAPPQAAQTLETFWAEVATTGTPLIEASTSAGHVSAGDVVVTFLWRGTPPGANEPTEAVLLLVNRVTNRRDLAASAMQHLEGTDVWHLSYQMQTDWQASYQLAPNTPALPLGGPPVHGSAAGPHGAGADDLAPQAHEPLLAQARPDPLAAHQLGSLWGGPQMSAATLPDVPHRPEWTPRAAQRSIARGRISIHHTDTARTVWVYESARGPGVPAQPRDLVVVLDGEIWAEVVDLPAALDVLVDSGQLPPLLVVMPQGPDRAARTSEFACNPELLSALRDELLPWVEGSWAVTTDPARRVICGQSMGGLAALWTATEAPASFGVALCQSGSFWWSSHDPDNPDAQWLTAQLAEQPARDIAVHLAVGARESLQLGPTRRLRDVLDARGYPVTLTEYNGGHDLLWWRAALVTGLVDALG